MFGPIWTLKLLDFIFFSTHFFYPFMSFPSNITLTNTVRCSQDKPRIYQGSTTGSRVNINQCLIKSIFLNIFHRFFHLTIQGIGYFDSLPPTIRTEDFFLFFFFFFLLVVSNFSSHLVLSSIALHAVWRNGLTLSSPEYSPQSSGQLKSSSFDSIRVKATDHNTRDER